MTETLTDSERAELLPFVAEKVAELLELASESDASTVERAVCLSLVRMQADDVPFEIAELFLEALEARGAEALGCLQATALLAPAPLALRAAEAVARRETAGETVSPGGLGDLKVPEALAVRLPGADVYLLRLQRPDDPRWHSASVIVEEADGKPVLVAATMAEAEERGGLADTARQLPTAGVTAVEPIEAAELCAVVEKAALKTRESRLGVGAEAVGCLPIIGRALGVRAEITCGLAVAGGTSSLALAPDDEAGFAETSEALLQAFEEWLAPEKGETAVLAPVVAQIMLDFKWGHRDADLGRWTEEDLTEFMLGYVPAKVDVDEDLALGLPDAAAAFLRFLDASGALTGEPVVELCLACERLAEPFLDAAMDRSHWGPAKTIAQQMLADGIDLHDEREVQAWVSGFNSLPITERDAVLGPLPQMQTNPGPTTSKAKGGSAQAQAKRKASRSARKRNR